jgi:AcrR family transcriptional regulator
MNMVVRIRVSLLDVVAEVLVADPSASLAEVATAAGIGRTTLHKQYATRDDLIRAVGFRSLDLWEQALSGISDTDADGGLRAVVAAMIPIGPQLAFLWRTPEFDHDKEIEQRGQRVEEHLLAVLKRAQDQGVLASAAPDWWLLQTFYALIYVGACSVRDGYLAPRDAPGYVMRMFLHGIGEAHAGEAHAGEAHAGEAHPEGAQPR